MKKLGALTISIFTATLILGVGLLPAWGQGAIPPASTKAVGQTSGHGVTLVEQSTPRKMSTSRSGPCTIKAGKRH